MKSSFIYSQRKSSDAFSLRPLDLDCLYPTGVYSKYCSDGHVRQIPLRCRNSRKLKTECFPCHKHRVIRVRMELRRRLASVKVRAKTVIMWTFGTSLLDDCEFIDCKHRKKDSCNRYEILRIWRNFMKYVRRRHSRNTFVFYTIESGKGNRLHVHAICRSFYAH